MIFAIFGGPRTPFSPLLAAFWRVFDPKIGQFLNRRGPERLIYWPHRPHFATSTLNARNLPFQRGGGRQLFVFGVVGGHILTPNSISGTHDRPRDDILDRIYALGRSRAPICLFGSDRPIFQKRHTNLGQSAAHFGLAIEDALILRASGLGVDNFGRGLAVSASKLGQFASLELTTGLAHLHEEVTSTNLQRTRHFRSYRSAIATQSG